MIRKQAKKTKINKNREWNKRKLKGNSRENKRNREVIVTLL